MTDDLRTRIIAALLSEDDVALMADAVIRELGGMEVLQYLEVPQRVLLSTPDWREAINENRPDYILAIRAQALDKVQELIEPYENDASPHPEAWARIVEAAFPPPPMAGRSSE